jgi:hypothetical protein
MVARVIQKPGIAQVIIVVADQKIEYQAAPQFMDVGNRVGAFLQQEVQQCAPFAAVVSVISDLLLNKLARMPGTSLIS